MKPEGESMVPDVDPLIRQRGDSERQVNDQVHHDPVSAKEEDV